MPIPREVLDVERPVNSIVIAYGKNKDLYAVRKRVGCKLVGGRHLPVNGPTIGHIVDGKYVPCPKADFLSLGTSDVQLKDWGNVLLCDLLFKDLFEEDLKRFYLPEDALKIYCIALLRVCHPGIKDYELQEAYGNSFLSELYPDVALSKNTVCKHLRNLGKACGRIRDFMQYRAKKVGLMEHLLIDGTLKTNNSTINSLSDFSRKTRIKGTKDISIVYAFDLEKMEPVCSKCYPGNMLDVTAYEDFIAENGITQGIIVADKGFPASAASGHFEKNPDLHYLNPIKRNSKHIARHDMLTFTDILKSDAAITFRKEKCQGKSKWLYAFRDARKAAAEEQQWLKKANDEDNYDAAELKRLQANFGTIVLECDLDIDAEMVYKAYAQRWEIEIVMRYYKAACEFDDTREHDDYSVIGSEFCDFLATVLTFRLIKRFDKAKVLEKMTYKKAMAILARAKKVKTNKDEWQLVRMNPSQIEILQKLELLPSPEQPPKRKRGRPRKIRI